MANVTPTPEQAAPNSKTQDCCGGRNAKDEKALSAERAQSHPEGDIKREHSRHGDGSGCCCGSDKADK
jgi:hypothetical protein